MRPCAPWAVTTDRHRVRYLPEWHLYTLFFFFFNDTATTEIYTLSLHDALLISRRPPTAGSAGQLRRRGDCRRAGRLPCDRSEEHTSELQSQSNLVCRLLLEKKKTSLCATCRRE